MKTYNASLEITVEVVVDSDDEEVGNDAALEAINQRVIAPMPLSVIGAWVSYVESDEDVRRGGKKR